MNKCNLMTLGIAAAGLAFPAMGQQLICVGMGAQDIASNGQTTLGFVYEADIGQNILYTWNRAAGGNRTGVLLQGQGAVRISSDGMVIGHPGYNVENLGGLAYSRTQGWLSTSLTRRWTLATGSVNLGIQPSGSACDTNINTPAAMSRDGRFFVGGGWFGAGSMCGPNWGWIYDNNTQAFTQLPMSFSPPPADAPSSTTGCLGVSDDGNTVVGYDQNYSAAGLGRQRLATVWTWNGTSWTNYHLDPNGGLAGCISGDGNVIFGTMSSYTMNQVFGTTTTSVIRWVRSGNTWTPTNLGGSAGFSPLRTNIDGSKMVGEQCFWSADVNGGAPMNLAAYLTSLGINMGGISIMDPFGQAVQAMSDDGTKIVFHVQESHGACLTTFQSMMADTSNAPCVPPGINFSPVSQPITGQAEAGPYGIILNVFATGTWPLTYQWQKETSPGTWTTLTEDPCGTFNPSMFDARGSDTSQLRLGFLSANNAWQGHFRCVVSNACGSATSGVAVIGLQSTCGSSDFNCDGDFGTDADIEAFFACLAGTCPAPPCMSTADFDGDGDVGTDADIESFFRVLAGGPC
jgi:hypothetical protein